METKHNSVLPMIITKSGIPNEPILEIIVCTSISGGANYKNNMPEGLTLLRKCTSGKEHTARYRQEGGEIMATHNFKTEIAEKQEGNHMGKKAEENDFTKALSERLPQFVFERIHQDIGAASMCWEFPEKAGVFDAEKASKIAFELCHFVADFLEGTGSGPEEKYDANI